MPQGVQRGGALRLLLARALAVAERDPVPIHLRGKGAGVIRPGLLQDAIGGIAREFGSRPHGERLEDLLEVALGIDFHGRLLIQRIEMFAGLDKHEGLHHLQPAIEVHGANERLEGVGQGGRAPATPVVLVAAPHHQVIAEANPAGVLSERPAGDEPGAELGEVSLVHIREAPEEMLAGDKLQHRVAEVFEPLVVEVNLLRLMTQAGVGERFGQQQRVAEFVADLLLKRVHPGAKLMAGEGRFKRSREMGGCFPGVTRTKDSPLPGPPSNKAKDSEPKTPMKIPSAPCFLLTLAVALPTFAPALRAQSEARAATSKTEATEKSGLTKADAKLIMTAAESDEAEITSAKIALKKTSNPKIKEYAEMMIKDHDKSTAKLKPIAMAGGITTPELMQNHKAMAAKLEAASGADFDKAYIEGNIEAHQDILSKMGAQEKGITNPELKMFVTETTPVIEHHLKMAKEMAKMM